MRVTLADLPQQHLPLRQEIEAAIREVLDSGQFILGPAVTALEQEIAAYTGASHAVAVNSGTDALLLALVAHGIGPGDEVITTPFTFVATVEAIHHCGARAVFADIDPRTFNLCPARTAERIGPKTRAIMPVDLFGLMADRQAFLSLRERHGVVLVWDSAQAIGATTCGKPVGAFPDTSTLSFFPTKNLGAVGDGGMVLTNDAEIAQRVVRFRFHGSGGGYFYDDIGYCSRLDTVQAAVLRVKLRYLEGWNAARKAHAAIYHERLAGVVDLPHEAPGATHTYHQFTIRHPRRDALRQFLKERGIDSGIYYPRALHMHPAYTYLGYREGDFPESERAAAEVLSLPVHPGLTDEHIVYVADSVRRFVESESA